MKKFTKIGLIPAAVLVLIGGTICVLGFVSGGWGLVDEMNMDDGFWHFLSRVGGEDAVRHIRHEITDDITDDIADSIREEAEDIEDEIRKETEDDVRKAIQGEFGAKASGENGNTGIGANQVRELEIQIGGAALCLMESGDDHFGVVIDGKGDYRYYESEGVFYLEGGKKHTTVHNEKVYLYIPKGKHFDDVEIDIGGGIISIDGLSADEVEMNAGAGVITSEQINCRSLSVEVGAGEAVLEGIEADEIDIEVGMGSATVSGKANYEIDASCGMGYLSLVLDHEETDFNYEIECAAGAINVGRQSYGALGNEAYVNNGASRECSLECSMGSIDVTFTK